MPKREQILKIASQKIRTVGYSNFSYADIAKEIGITKPSLHYYFASKEDLAIAICDLTENFWRTAFDKVLDNINVPTALAKLERLVNKNIKTLQKDEICGLVSFLNSYEAFPETLQKRIAALVEFEYGLYKELIQKAVVEKELPNSIDVNQCTVELISIIKGSMIYRRADHHFDQMLPLLHNLFHYWRR